MGVVRDCCEGCEEEGVGCEGGGAGASGVGVEAGGASSAKG